MTMNITDEDWKVVEARLETMPEEMTIGMLSHTFTKRELLVEVRGKTEFGIAYAEMQLGFVKWLLKQSEII